MQKNKKKIFFMVGCLHLSPPSLGDPNVAPSKSKKYSSLEESSLVPSFSNISSFVPTFEGASSFEVVATDWVCSKKVFCCGCCGCCYGTSVGFSWGCYGCGYSSTFVTTLDSPKSIPFASWILIG